MPCVHGNGYAASSIAATLSRSSARIGRKFGNGSLRIATTSDRPSCLVDAAVSPAPAPDIAELRRLFSMAASRSAVKPARHALELTPERALGLRLPRDRSRIGRRDPGTPSVAVPATATPASRASASPNTTSPAASASAPVVGAVRRTRRYARTRARAAHLRAARSRPCPHARQPDRALARPTRRRASRRTPMPRPRRPRNIDREAHLREPLRLASSRMRAPGCADRRRTPRKPCRTQRRTRRPSP